MIGEKASDMIKDAWPVSKEDKMDNPVVGGGEKKEAIKKKHGWIESLVIAKLTQLLL